MAGRRIASDPRCLAGSAKDQLPPPPVAPGVRRLSPPGARSRTALATAMRSPPSVIQVAVVGALVAACWLQVALAAPGPIRWRRHRNVGGDTAMCPVA